MSVEQYSALIGIMPQIEELLKRQGEKVPRPDYSRSAHIEPDENGEEEDDGEKMDAKKANIEATSDEEE